MLKNLIAVIFCSMFCFSACGYAMEKMPTIVPLSFTDNTPYTDMRAGKIMDDLLVDRLLAINGFDIVEQSEAADILEVEGQLNITPGGLAEAVNSNDFSYIFNASENDLTMKKEGEFVSAAATKIIGQKHNADYILHGTIDYLGKDSHNIMLPLKNFSFGSSTPYLEAVATVRIIDAATGKIVWVKKAKGVSRDSLVKLQNLTIGTGEFNNQLFYEALDKISKEVAKSLEKDLRSGKIF